MKEIKNILQELGEKITWKVKNRLPDGSGKLKESFRQQLVIKKDNYQLIFNAEDYFNYVLEGRKPGKQPPPDIIKKWIEVKKILPQPVDGEKLPTENQLAFLIGRKIGEQGIEGHPEIEEEISQILNSNLEKIIQVLKTEMTTEIFNLLNK